MSRSRLLLLAAVLAGATAVAEGAAAQNFFERLFGIRPSEPFYPPANVPRGPAPAPMPGAPDEAGLPPGPVAPSGPPPPKPVVLRAPTEDGVLGRELKLNGAAGSLRLERAGADLRAQITLAGAKISQPTQACTVKLGEGAPLTLTNAGRRDGLQRYEVPAPSCPIAFEILDGAVLVTDPKEVCVVEAADCRVEPQGLWGPEPASLLPKAREIEQARGQADRAVRENYKVLTQRAKPQEVRPIVSEQAAFSSEREQLCRSYQREGGHGFCNARFTEARAVALASRLGVLAPAAEAPPERRPRPPRQAGSPMPPPPSSGLNPSDVR
jgi:hypothetical protein